MAVRRKPIRLFTRVHLPDSVGAISVPAVPAQNSRPEHEALYFFAAGLHNALVTHFSNQHRHLGAGSERAIHGLDGVGHALAVAVTRLQHVEVEHRWIVHALPPAARWMDRHRMMMRIDGMHI